MEIDYRILSRGNVVAILKKLALSDGEASFTELESTGIPNSTLEYNLDMLVNKKIITRTKRGPIKLTYKTPLCYVFDSPSAYAYLGLLGERNERDESETETAINLLKEERISFGKIVVATTHGAVAEWENLTHLNIEWRLLSDKQISRVSDVEEKVMSRLVELLKNYKVVMDCTSATKPATIAYYRLAAKFKVPLIYVYEKGKELVWIVSVEDLKMELLGHLI